jgi:hypothetical protein
MIPTIATALRGVSTPRFFETERGYQGEFLARLHASLPEIGLPGSAIVEQEYQKRLKDHGITVRPDVIIHVPTREGGNRREGNFAVFELKRKATLDEAREDFGSLDAVIKALNYPLGVFLNIDSDDTQARNYDGAFGDRIHFFAVRLVNETVQLRHAYRVGNQLIEE